MEWKKTLTAIVYVTKYIVSVEKLLCNVFAFLLCPFYFFFPSRCLQFFFFFLQDFAFFDRIGFSATTWVLRLPNAWQMSLKLAISLGKTTCFSQSLSPTAVAQDSVHSGFENCRLTSILRLSAPEFDLKVKKKK